MGDRNHLHVCRNCGNVMATSSKAHPRTCTDCGEDNFSLFLILPETVLEPEESVTWRLYGQFAREIGIRETAVDIGTLPAPTVRNALHALIDKNPALRDVVLTEDEELRGNGVIVHNHVNVYNEPDHLDSRVGPRDTLGLFPRIS